MPIIKPDQSPHITHVYAFHGVHIIASLSPKMKVNSLGRSQHRGMMAKVISIVDIVSYHFTIYSTLS